MSLRIGRLEIVKDYYPHMKFFCKFGLPDLPIIGIARRWFFLLNPKAEREARDE